ncbi:MAG: acetyltransferase [Clostridiales bacterium]|nr:acetyltransferase [Clostridiales bacterium]
MFESTNTKIVNTDISNGANVYNFCDVRNSKLGKESSIGDFSRIGDSCISDNCIIQRNNMIYSSNIGRYTYTGKNCTIWHSTIGSFCSVSWNVSIGGANHDYKRITTHSFLYSNDFGLKPQDELGYNRFENKCIIGNDVWIAANACICRGVNIGNGAVIAAGAVVTKNVEPYAVVAGVPARKIKMRFSNEIIELLNESEWWNLPSEIIKSNYVLFNKEANFENASRILDLCKTFFNKQGVL